MYDSGDLVAALIDPANGGHNVRPEVDVYRGGGVIRTLTASILGASVRADRTAAVLRTASLALADPTGLLRPQLPDDNLSPFGTEWRLFYGVSVGGGYHRIPMGVYEVTGYGHGGGVLSYDLSDRAFGVEVRGFERPYVAPTGVTVADAIRQVILDPGRYPSATVTVTGRAATEIVTPVIAEEAGRSDGAWAYCRGLAASVGAECYWDRTGGLRIADLPETVTFTDPVRTWPASWLTSAPRSDLDVAGIRNVFVVLGESAERFPVRASAEVVDPADPAWTTRIGRRPVAVNDKRANTAGKANDLALYLRRTRNAAVRVVNVSVVPDPLVDPGDFVAVSSPADGIEMVGYLESIGVDLGGSSSSAVVRYLSDAPLL